MRPFKRSDYCKVIVFLAGVEESFRSHVSPLYAGVKSTQATDLVGIGTGSVPNVYILQTGSVNT
jgi:hypothetical protein